MVDTATFAADGNLRLVFATWVYLLHTRGIEADDAALAAAVAAVDAATDSGAGDLAGEALVERVAALLTSAEPADVAALARRLYGDRVGDFGDGDRDARLSRVRKAQFARSLPWIARIWERRDGVVAPSWLLVEEVTDEVLAMDPNPWNDVDEQRVLPLTDFLVLWELDGFTAIVVG